MYSVHRLCFQKNLPSLCKAHAVCHGSQHAAFPIPTRIQLSDFQTLLYTIPNYDKSPQNHLDVVGKQTILRRQIYNIYLICRIHTFVAMTPVVGSTPSHPLCVVAVLRTGYLPVKFFLFWVIQKSFKTRHWLTWKHNKEIKTAHSFFDIIFACSLNSYTFSALNVLRISLLTLTASVWYV